MSNRVVRISGPGQVANNAWVGHKLAVVASGRGRFFSAVATNASGADAYLQIFDRAGAVVAGDKPLASVQVRNGQTGSLDWASGRPFNLGMHVAFSTTASEFQAPGNDGFLIDACYETA